MPDSTPGTTEVVVSRAPDPNPTLRHHRDLQPAQPRPGAERLRPPGRPGRRQGGVRRRAGCPHRSRGARPLRSGIGRRAGPRGPSRLPSRRPARPCIGRLLIHRPSQQGDIPMFTRRLILSTALATGALALAGAANAQDWKAKYPELVLAVVPAENASGVTERYAPFV